MSSPLGKKPRIFLLRFFPIKDRAQHWQLPPPAGQYFFYLASCEADFVDKIKLILCLVTRKTEDIGMNSMRNIQILNKQDHLKKIWTSPFAQALT